MEIGGIINSWGKRNAPLNNYKRNEIMNVSTAESIAEMMEKYNKARQEWQDKLGIKFDEDIFHAWFTNQITG